MCRGGWEVGAQKRVKWKDWKCPNRFISVFFIPRDFPVPHSPFPPPSLPHPGLPNPVQNLNLPLGLFVYRSILCCHSQILFWRLLCPLTWPLTHLYQESWPLPVQVTARPALWSRVCHLPAMPQLEPGYNCVHNCGKNAGERREMKDERGGWGEGGKSSFLHLATLFWWSPKNQTASPDCVLRRKGDGRRGMASAEYLLCACTMSGVLRSV